jgi:hypothetical protein
MTPDVSQSQLHLAVGGDGVQRRMSVDGSSGGRPRGRQTKVNRETPIDFMFRVDISRATWS